MKKQSSVFPKHKRMLEQMGENIKLARKRRKLTTGQVAERAGVARSTLYHLETGNPSVSLGTLLNVLRVLNLADDFLKLGSDDELGQKIRDFELLKKG